MRKTSDLCLLLFFFSLLNNGCRYERKAINPPVSIAPSTKNSASSTSQDQKEYQYIIHQIIVPPIEKSDHRVKVKASLEIDPFKVDLNGTYALAVQFDVTNLSSHAITLRSSNRKLKLSAGHLLGLKDMLQSDNVEHSYRLRPGETASPGAPGDLKALFRVNSQQKVDQLIYDDGNSYLTWKVRPKL
jgi:hypothetical protein